MEVILQAEVQGDVQVVGQCLADSRAEDLDNPEDGCGFGDLVEQVPGGRVRHLLSA